jgi:hypothetical protein
VDLYSSYIQTTECTQTCDVKLHHFSTNLNYKQIKDNIFKRKHKSCQAHPEKYGSITNAYVVKDTFQLSCIYHNLVKTLITYTSSYGVENKAKTVIFIMNN